MRERSASNKQHHEKSLRGAERFRKTLNLLASIMGWPMWTHSLDLAGSFLAFIAKTISDNDNKKYKKI